MGVPSGPHHRRSYLAEANAVPPSCANQCKVCRHIVPVSSFDHDERRTVEMRRRERPSYFKFPAYGHAPFPTDNLEEFHSPGRTAFERDEIGDRSEIDAALSGNQRGEFLLTILHTPTVEIRRGAVNIAQRSPQDVRISDVAEGVRQRTHPRPGAFLGLRARQGRARLGVHIAYKIGYMHGVPDILVRLGDPSTRLRVASIADGLSRHQNLSPCFGDGPGDCRRSTECDSVKSLTMIVRADIELMVRLSVVPAEARFAVVGEGERAGGPVPAHLFPLRQYPAARSDRMSTKELPGSIGTHLRGDNAGEVFFERHHIDREDAIDRFPQPHTPAEPLVLAPFPMESGANGDTMEDERSPVRVERTKCNFLHRGLTERAALQDHGSAGKACLCRP